MPTATTRRGDGPTRTGPVEAALPTAFRWRQQRVKIAVAWSRPRLLILDEPTTGMDPAARRVFLTPADEIRDQGVTTLMTTHQPDEAGTRVDQRRDQPWKVIADASPAALIDHAPVWFTCARHLDLDPLRSKSSVPVSR